MVSTLIIFIAVVLLIVMRNLSKRSVITRGIVYAGNPHGEDAVNVGTLSLPKNNPEYRIGDHVIDVTNLSQFVVHGHSLEPLNIRDGSVIFVSNIDATEKLDLEKFIGRFLVFKIDNDRTLREYPLKNISVVENGLKVRKVVKILRREDDMTATIEAFLEANDCDYIALNEQDRRGKLDKYLRKCRFAFEYYNSDAQIIMSITYRNGIEKDYSFHSPAWVFGVVEYSSK